MRSVRSGFIFGVLWILDSTFLENRGVKFVSKDNIVLKLLCVGLNRCFEVALTDCMLRRIVWNGPEDLR